MVSTISQRMHQRLLDKGVAQGRALLAEVAIASNRAVATVECAQAAINNVAIVFVFCGNGAGRADLVMPSKLTGMLASARPGLIGVRFQLIHMTQALS